MPTERATEIVGILLAAGSGRRFGGDKQLHPLPDGTPMAVAAARNLHAACACVVAVIRPDHLALAQLLKEENCEIVVCSDAEQGMGHSLASGVRATRDAAGWIVALADMPFIATGSYTAVIDALRAGATLAATQYRGQRGHPVGFSREWRDELITLNGDIGGRSILEKHRERIVLCNVEDRGVLIDIDRRDDL